MRPPDARVVTRHANGELLHDEPPSINETRRIALFPESATAKCVSLFARASGVSNCAKVPIPSELPGCPKHELSLINFPTDRIAFWLVEDCTL